MDMGTRFEVITPDDSWREDAACLGLTPDVFYPDEQSSPKDKARAIRICAGCAVRDQCLQFALANNEKFGIWGGLPVGARRRMHREMNDAARIATECTAASTVEFVVSEGVPVIVSQNSDDNRRAS